MLQRLPTFIINGSDDYRYFASPPVRTQHNIRGDVTHTVDDFSLDAHASVRVRLPNNSIDPTSDVHASQQPEVHM